MFDLRGDVGLGLLAGVGPGLDQRRRVVRGAAVAVGFGLDGGEPLAGLGGLVALAAQLGALLALGGEPPARPRRSGRPARPRPARADSAAWSSSSACPDRDRSASSRPSRVDVLLGVGPQLGGAGSAAWPRGPRRPRPGPAPRRARAWASAPAVRRPRSSAGATSAARSGGGELGAASSMPWASRPAGRGFQRVGRRRWRSARRSASRCRSWAWSSSGGGATWAAQAGGLGGGGLGQLGWPSAAGRRPAQPGRPARRRLARRRLARRRPERGRRRPGRPGRAARRSRARPPRPRPPWPCGGGRATPRPRGTGRCRTAAAAAWPGRRRRRAGTCANSPCGSSTTWKNWSADMPIRSAISASASPTRVETACQDPPVSSSSRTFACSVVVPAPRSLAAFLFRLAGDPHPAAAERRLELDLGRGARRGVIRAQPPGLAALAGDPAVQGEPDGVEQRGLARARLAVQQEQPGGGQVVEADLHGAAERAERGHAQPVRAHQPAASSPSTRTASNALASSRSSPAVGGALLTCLTNSAAMDRSSRPAILAR